jgi:2-iminobutanoate/2-iminopropanoate deaminase
VYSEFFRGIRPARTTVQSVLGDGIKVEIDAVARVRE